jgi:hypothetical protein
MIDLLVVQPQELIDVSQAQERTDIAVRTFELHGADLRNVTEVLMNGEPSPSFIIRSRSRILAQVPDAWATERITSILAVSSRLTLSPRSQIRFSLGSQLRVGSGMLRLIQLFLKILLTTPGTDIFARRLGGGLLTKFGATYGAGDGMDLIGDVVIAVSQTAGQITAIQGRQSQIPSDERLLSATVIGRTFNKQEATLSVQIELKNQAGQLGFANVELLWQTISRRTCASACRCSTPA